MTSSPTPDGRRRLAHFTAFLTGVGYHESAWKLADPADLAGPARFGVLERAALDAERGLLDAVFFADSPGLATSQSRQPHRVHSSHASGSFVSFGCPSDQN